MSFQRRLSAVTIALIAALLVLFLVTAPKTVFAAPQKAVRMSEVLPSRTEEDKIYSLIRISRPRRGTAFAKKAASIMVDEAKKQNLPPFLCASVAYMESHFDQDSSPCVGIMQVHRSSLHEYVQKKQGKLKGLDPDDWEDNIRIGVRELGMHKKKYHSLRGTLGRYNGCGAGGAYVDRVMTIYKHLANSDPDDWKASLNRGRELWR